MSTKTAMKCSRCKHAREWADLQPSTDPNHSTGFQLVCRDEDACLTARACIVCKRELAIMGGATGRLMEDALTRHFPRWCSFCVLAAAESPAADEKFAVLRDELLASSWAAKRYADKLADDAERRWGTAAQQKWDAAERARVVSAQRQYDEALAREKAARAKRKAGGAP